MSWYKQSQNVDTSLIMEARSLAGSGDIHHILNVISCYQMQMDLYNSRPTEPKWKQKANETERWLRKYVYDKKNKLNTKLKPVFASKGVKFVGTIKRQDDGFSYVKVDDEIINGLFAAMDKSDGAVKAPYFDKDGIGAHISFISSEEGEKMKGVKIKELGDVVHFELGEIVSLNPEGWDEMDKVWFVQVKCPELSKIRKSYGLPATYNGSGHKFHITFAVKKNKKAFYAGVLKIAGDYGNSAPSNQQIENILMGDVQRYVMDSYNITISLSDTPSKYSVSLVINHTFLGSIGYDEYWIYDKSEKEKALQNFKKIKKEMAIMINEFISEERPTSMFWSYVKSLCKDLDREHQVTSYIPNVNYSKRYEMSPDWSSNLYGSRYPKYHEENYKSTVKFKGRQTD